MCPCRHITTLRMLRCVVPRRPTRVVVRLREVYSIWPQGKAACAKKCSVVYGNRPMALGSEVQNLVQAQSTDVCYCLAPCIHLGRTERDSGTKYGFRLSTAFRYYFSTMERVWVVLTNGLWKHLHLEKEGEKGRRGGGRGRGEEEEEEKKDNNFIGLSELRAPICPGNCILQSRLVGPSCHRVLPLFEQ